jgi:hypothetical protein
MITKFNQLFNDLTRTYPTLNTKRPVILIDPDLNHFTPPRVHLDCNIIEVSESFLNFLWAVIYFTFTYQEKSNEYLLINPDAEALPVDTDVLKNAESLLRFCKSILNNGYTNWPIGIISPFFNGNPNNEIEVFSIKTNGLFVTAINVLLMHEVGHIHFNHINESIAKYRIKKLIDEDDEYEPPIEELAPIIMAETNADNFAMDIFLNTNDDPIIQLNNSYGTCICFIALLFCTRTIKGVTQIFHPDLHERVYRAIQRICDLSIEEASYFEHFASQSLMLIMDQQNYQLRNYDAGYNTHDFLLEVLDQVDEAL